MKLISVCGYHSAKYEETKKIISLLKNFCGINLHDYSLLIQFHGSFGESTTKRVLELDQSGSKNFREINCLATSLIFDTNVDLTEKMFIFP